MCLLIASYKPTAHFWAVFWVDEVKAGIQSFEGDGSSSQGLYIVALTLAY
jgi:hypothetical protein